MKKSIKILFFALAVPAFALIAGEGEATSHYATIAGRETDFVPRLFNFIIFAGLVYYLVADMIRNFFQERKDKIASQLSEIETHLQEAKSAKKRAEQTLAESEKKAQEILEDAKKEALLLSTRYKELGEKEEISLENQYKERMDMQKRKMQRELIVSLLDENINSDDIPLSGTQIINNLAKEVA